MLGDTNLRSHISRLNKNPQHISCRVDLDNHLSDQVRFGLYFLDDTLQSYFRIIVLLYAYDAALFAENENELQDFFNKFQNYCKINK